MKISEKDIARLLSTLSKNGGKPYFTSAIIAAAGIGARMGNTDGKTKQMMELCGKPMIVHTLLAFEECELVDEIVVVAKRDEIPIYREYKRNYGITKITKITEGGERRQDSVLLGFEEISDRSEFVAIHDGARCLITPDMIEKVLRAAYQSGAATAATPVVDTIKRGTMNNYIAETYKRSELWAAQTPQIFKTELYRAAAYIAKEEDFEATDDNSLAERLGFDVKLVDCGRENLKITTPLDLKLASLILDERK